jgi:glycosyltransferase involved in cell wall biosynthesis
MSRSYPRISIVTTSFNQGLYIEEALLSVKQQDYPAIEHIVIDGASTDGTVEILRRYSEMPEWGHLRWISEPDHGQSDALNKGFRMAKGDVIGWLNSDDFYLKGSFQHVAEAFEECPATDVLYGDYVWTDENRRPIQIRREIAFSRFVLFHNHTGFIHSSGALFLSRRIVDDGHFINESYDGAMDYEFYLRLANAGYCFCHVPALLSGFRWHRSNKSTAQAKRQAVEYEKARIEHLRNAGQLRPGATGRFALGLLRVVASGRRWGEKAVRGYYFTQFFPVRVKELVRRSPIE